MSVTVFTIFFLFMAVGMITLLLLNTRKVCRQGRQGNKVL